MTYVMLLAIDDAADNVAVAGELSSVSRDEADRAGAARVKRVLGALPLDFTVRWCFFFSFFSFFD